MAKANDMGLNDAAWANILAAYPDILKTANEGGMFEIEAKQIKAFREPRLMTKFDTSESVAAPLKKNGLNVLPASRHSYFVGRFQLYQDFPPVTGIKPLQISLPDLETLTVDNLTSESNAINALLATHTLEKFLGISDELLETFNGRMGTDDFSFRVDLNQKKAPHFLPPVQVNVGKAQMEIDGGFESKDYVCIMEAKNIRHDDFNVRQLYFPFRKYAAFVHKPIRLVFSQYTNLSYYLYEYEFDDPENFSSIHLYNLKIYTFEDSRISRDDLYQVWKETEVTTDDDRAAAKVPFPQADRFDRVISLAEKLYSMEGHFMKSDQVIEFMGMTSRQAGFSGYYSTAGDYAGLLDRSENGVLRLTKAAVSILALPYKKRQLAFVGLLLKHRIFHDFLLDLIQGKPFPERKDVENKMLAYNVCTAPLLSRRAQTVMGWLHWIMDLVEINQ